MVKNYNCLMKRTQGIGKCLVLNEVLGKVALLPAPRFSQIPYFPTAPSLLRVEGCLQIRHYVLFENNYLFHIETFVIFVSK